MKILILGSEGFIGQHLVRYYVEQEWIVTGCDLTETKSGNYDYYKISLLSNDIDRLFEQGSFDACINAAGSGNVGYSIQFPLSDFESNVYAVTKILDSLRAHNRECTYLHISSAAVYGNPQKLPVKETDPANPLSPYGWHKWMSELLCREYTRLFGLKTVILRPFSVYGPGLRKQLFWELHQKYNLAKDHIELWGTGKESRDFIFIKDLVLAIDAVLKHGDHSGEVYNIASGRETSIEEIASSLLSCYTRKLQIKFNQQVRPGDPLNWRADISRLERLGFKPSFSTDQGIRQVAEWLNALH
jgi:UDP-glucose 4-epimerase